MAIELLSEALINQIAAGEVIERPAAVVRELIDNSLDAGATNIEVEIEGGGKNRVVVRDNGCGMSRSDVPLAFLRHATSKVRSFEDIVNLKTRGFRGEALASIAAVAEVTVVTRTDSETSATMLSVSGDKIRGPIDAVRAVGTTVEVGHLFASLPARRKFLKGDRTEEGKIVDLIIEWSLAAPQTAWRLVVDGRERHHFPARESRRLRGRELYPGPYREVDYQLGTASVEGLIAHPAVVGGVRDNFRVFINDRVVSDRVVMRAVKEAFRGGLKDREQPLGFLAVSLPPGAVDFNVHPQKREVRFLEPPTVYRLVYDAVSKALLSVNEGAFTSKGRGLTDSSVAFSSVENRRTANEGQWWQRHSGVGLSPVSSLLTVSATTDAATPEIVGYNIPLKGCDIPWGELTCLGVLPPVYGLCRWGDDLVVVDLHAAHEKVNFHRIVTDWREGTIVTQALLMPFSLALSRDGGGLQEDEREFLRSIGFSTDERGDLTGVPARLGLLGPSALDALLNEVLAARRDDVPLDAVMRLFFKRAARLACRASIRGGDSFGSEAVMAVLDELLKTPGNQQCPHGRPIGLVFTATELKRRFGRSAR